VQVLGFNAFIHDAAAALVRDGVIVAAAREEQFTGRKHTGEFPRQAIRHCLDRAGGSLEQLDGVAYYWRPWLGLPRRAAVAASALPGSLRLLGAQGTVRGTPAAWLRHCAAPLTLRRAFGGFRRFAYVPHHHAHAYGAYLSSPFEAATIVSLDLAGEAASTFVAAARGERITPLWSVDYPHSLGSFFATITQYLGYRPLRDEYKVMGLAAFGAPRLYDELRRLLTLEPGGRFRLDTSVFAHHRGGAVLYTPRLCALLGPPPAGGRGRHCQRSADLAASAQAVLADVSRHVVEHAIAASGAPDLCLTGGVALNAVMVHALRRARGVGRIYVPVAPDDAGTAAGSALRLWHELAGGAAPRPSPTRPGPAYGDDVVRRELERAGCRFEPCGDVAERAARLLAAGEIVAWFQGPAELGPRALGGRSILADPRSVRIAQRLSRTIKDRDGFRPFAASVLAARAFELFELTELRPYMNEVCAVRPRWRGRLAGVTHADGSCRPQTVTERDAPELAALLAAFARRTGVPVLLNTSFNAPEQPMVCTPRQAIETFRRLPLRWLVIGSFAVSKAPAPPSAE